MPCGKSCVLVCVASGAYTGRIEPQLRPAAAQPHLRAHLYSTRLISTEKGSFWVSMLMMSDWKRYCTCVRQGSRSPDTPFGRGAEREGRLCGWGLPCRTCMQTRGCTNYSKSGRMARCSSTSGCGGACTAAVYGLSYSHLDAVDVGDPGRGASGEEGEIRFLRGACGFRVCGSGSGQRVGGCGEEPGLGPWERWGCAGR